jgi:hypothetical protein
MRSRPRALAAPGAGARQARAPRAALVPIEATAGDADLIVPETDSYTDGARAFITFATQRGLPTAERPT